MTTQAKTTTSAEPPVAGELGDGGSAIDRADGAPGPGGDEVLTGYVLDVLAEERARKASLEARGASLVTSAGAVVTLVLAIATFGADEARGTRAGVWLLVAAVLFLFLSAACGAWLNRPVRYDEPKPGSLRHAIEDGWEGAATAARRAVAKNAVDILEDARQKNGRKARWLTTGTILLVLAVLAIALACAATLLPGA